MYNENWRYVLYKDFEMRHTGMSVVEPKTPSEGNICRVATGTTGGKTPLETTLSSPGPYPEVSRVIAVPKKILK